MDDTQSAEESANILHSFDQAEEVNVCSFEFYSCYFQYMNIKRKANYVDIWRHLLVTLCHASQPPRVCTRMLNVETKVVTTEIKILQED